MQSSRLRKVLIGTGAALVAVLVTGFVLWPKTPLNLGEDDHMSTAGVYQHWRAGDVAVLVRHSERCDRSSNPCLGPADGITQVGSAVAAEVGKSFRTLGMENADILSSPITRTLQTATSMFATTGTTQEWLASCGDAMSKDVLAHKTAHRNLVLVTHSGCISDLEKQQGFEHAKASEYTSSLFVAVADDGKLKILGVLNAEDWPQALKNTSK